MMSLGPRRVRPYSFSAPIEVLLLLCCLFWVVVVNRPFFGAALAGRTWDEPATWGFTLALGVGLVALHALLLAPLCNRFTVKPLLVVMIVATAFAGHFMHHLGVYLDPSMLRNTVRTDVHEAGELFSWSMLPHLLLFAGVPLLVLWRADVRVRAWPRALALRLVFIVLMAAVLVAAVMSIFQPLASLMRNQKELRYLITPANYLWSGGTVLAAEFKGKAAPKRVIGEDAQPGPSWASRSKPQLLVLVVGETARAANWGLNGYARQTTPRLATLPVINFSDVTSCGTNTEVSLPCMFAPVGRRDYDEAVVRNSQTLLHLLARAGVAVNWLDNQSGCKGVCDGLPNQEVLKLAPPGLCEHGRCLDEGLLHGLDELLAQSAKGKSTQLLVLHQLGSHGPSYFKRYPKTFSRFVPACEHDDLRKCSREEIVNAYDNSLLYTDHVLALLIEKLRANSAVDTAMLYISDHGESLGENNLYLHGIPYAIAPDVQKKVPFVLWLSDGFASSTGLNVPCLKQRAAVPLAHDHLFHTLVGLFDVRTRWYEPAWDMALACRAKP
jgi:lipid A ethanolaminephosphotransferase